MTCQLRGTPPRPILPQLHTHFSLEPHTYFSLQLHTYFSLQLHIHFSLQLHTYFSLHLYTYFSLQLHSHFSLQLHTYCLPPTSYCRPSFTSYYLLHANTCRLLLTAAFLGGLRRIR